MKINVPTYTSKNLPIDLKLIKITRPGSRFVK